MFHDFGEIDTRIESKLDQVLSVISYPASPSEQTGSPLRFDWPIVIGFRKRVPKIISHHIRDIKLWKK